MKQNLSKKTRTESDLIGSREVPESALYGVQTLRGIENFRISKFHLNEYPFVYSGFGYYEDGSCRCQSRTGLVDGRTGGRYLEGL